MKADEAERAKSATADLMIKLASAIDEGRARDPELEPEAAAARLVRHLSKKAAQNDIGAVVSFFSNALGLAREAMHDAEETRSRPDERSREEKRGRPSGSDRWGKGASLAGDQQRDSSYWLG
jgi:hypothetical protein